ncbi:hypothetical protein BJP37_02255 [Moorena bouillonii PNG]|uniref:Uncharacterized protein n=1 Tax=Moorena bouillonii PNG TaxID=568701 RepID=A0A1U7MWG4_9CYAN|nr:hypothetical protein BJP37_02255 [Moorena bouillonii PNG]
MWGEQMQFIPVPVNSLKPLSKQEVMFASRLVIGRYYPVRMKNGTVLPLVGLFKDLVNQLRTGIPS